MYPTIAAYPSITTHKRQNKRSEKKQILSYKKRSRKRKIVYTMRFSTAVGAVAFLVWLYYDKKERAESKGMAKTLKQKVLNLENEIKNLKPQNENTLKEYQKELSEEKNSQEKSPQQQLRTENATLRDKLNTIMLGTAHPNYPDAGEIVLEYYKPFHNDGLLKNTLTENFIQLYGELESEEDDDDENDEEDDDDENDEEDDDDEIYTPFEFMIDRLADEFQFEIMVTCRE
jgi:hypothetical protein